MKTKSKTAKTAAPKVAAKAVVAAVVKHERRGHSLSIRSRSGGRRLGGRRKGGEAEGHGAMVKPGELHFHPLLESTPTMSSVIGELRKLVKTARGSTLMDAKARLAEREPEWKAFVLDVKRRGVREYIVVTRRPQGGFWVVDGRNRTCAAIEAGLELVAVQVTDEAPEDVILGSLAARRHVSKELLAFVALECHKNLIGEGFDGRPTVETGNEYRFNTRAELADCVGVSEATLKVAARVHRLFMKSPKLRKKWEWRIYAGTSLKGVLAGDAAEGAAGDDLNGKAKYAASERVRKFLQGVAGRVAKDWAALEAEGEERLGEVRLDFQAALAELPDAAFEWVLDLAETNRRVQVKEAMKLLKQGGR
jgi:hypothetical protein